MERNIKDSQNFLHNAQLVNKLVGLSNITCDDLVYEIGPGKGIITRALLGRCRQVVAIEYDAELYRRLLEQLKGARGFSSAEQGLSNSRFAERAVQSFFLTYHST
ncbi:hypothetical protein FSC17_15230 (plasmid) [Acinetobacter indicus]|nr:hypothetical protein FSC17_15230 [Acinetobacter indicus]